MSDGDLWQLAVISSPLVSGTVARLLAPRGISRGSSVPLSLVAGIAFLLIANLFVGRPDEWALVLIVSVFWWPFMIAGAFVGHAFGKRAG